MIGLLNLSPAKGKYVTPISINLADTKPLVWIDVTRKSNSVPAQWPPSALFVKPPNFQCSAEEEVSSLLVHVVTNWFMAIYFGFTHIHVHRCVLEHYILSTFPSVVKINHRHNYSGGIRTHDLCNSRVVSYKLDHGDWLVARDSWFLAAVWCLIWVCDCVLVYPLKLRTLIKWIRAFDRVGTSSLCFLYKQ